MNYQLERMWKDRVVAYLRELLYHLPGKTEKTIKMAG
jgi:hypothetical protein